MQPRIIVPGARQEERPEECLNDPQTGRDRLHGLLMTYRQGDISVVWAYRQQQASDIGGCIFDLVRVRAAETHDPNRRKEARALRVGLQ